MVRIQAPTANSTTLDGGAYLVIRPARVGRDENGARVNIHDNCCRILEHHIERPWRWGVRKNLAFSYWLK